jgi:hypothetical protein
MTVSSRQVSVPTGSAAELTDGTGAVLHQSYELYLVNHDGTNPVYLGDNTVTSATGAQLAAGASLGVSLTYGEKLFARATGGAVTVGVLQSKF